MYTYVSDDGRKKPSYSAHYRLGQALPPRHWYQKRLGWAGRLMIGLFVLVTIGSGLTVKSLLRAVQQPFAAQAASGSLTETTKPLSDNPTIQNIVDIQSVLDAWNTSHKSQNWAVVAHSLTGPSFDARINADKQFESSSVNKLFMTLPLFTQVPVEQQSHISLSLNGVQKSMATCVDLMLRLSNNDCANAVDGYINWQKANDALKSAGLKHSVFEQQGKLKTTAADTANFLVQLNGDMVNRIAKQTIMTSLYQQSDRSGIPAGCPGCTVADKTSQSNDVVHDVAIVQYRGGTYVLAIFSQSGSSKQISQLTGQIQQKILNTTR